MSAQNRYGYSTPIGAAGGIVDLAPYAIDTFLNEEENGAMKFGVGVVKGSKPGINAALPETAAKAADFEGVVTNNRTTEYDMDGNLVIRKGASMGVMRYGRIYARVVNGVKPAYGDPVYLITSGENAGYFTNAADATGESDDEEEDTDSTATTVAVKARFLGGVDATAQIAVIELFNQNQA